MTLKRDPRIHTDLLSVNPTAKRPAWHGCPTALGVLRGVGPVTATWRPFSEANSIREIALHIAFWENSVANRIGGQRIPAGFRQRKTGWAVKLDSIGAAQWREEIALVSAAHQRLIEALVGFDSAKLDRPAGKRTSRKAVELIHGVAEHSLYHTAQMKLIMRIARNQGAE
jgi:uncharacterized damage-inducible protein DinB